MKIKFIYLLTFLIFCVLVKQTKNLLDTSFKTEEEMMKKKQDLLDSLESLSKMNEKKTIEIQKYDHTEKKTTKEEENTKDDEQFQTTPQKHKENKKEAKIQNQSNFAGKEDNKVKIDNQKAKKEKENQKTKKSKYIIHSSFPSMCYTDIISKDDHILKARHHVVPKADLLKFFYNLFDINFRYQTNILSLKKLLNFMNYILGLCTDLVNEIGWSISEYIKRALDLLIWYPFNLVAGPRSENRAHDPGKSFDKELLSGCPDDTVLIFNMLYRFVTERNKEIEIIHYLFSQSLGNQDTIDYFYQMIKERKGGNLPFFIHNFLSEIIFCSKESLMDKSILPLDEKNCNSLEERIKSTVFTIYSHRTIFIIYKFIEIVNINSKCNRKWVLDINNKDDTEKKYWLMPLDIQSKN